MKRQAGFTLIELVVVILILSVLAATALPRFMNVTTQAHTAAVAGTGGGFSSAVALAHAQWVANGLTGAETDLAGFGDGTIDTNATGWPIGTDGTLNNVDDCVDMWGALMQNPPSASDAGTPDYLVTYAGNVCTYTYQADTTKIIAYTPATGVVVVTN